MSRAAKGALAFGAAVVLWRTADLFLFTDVPTGFCAGGAVWRYAAMGLCALAAWLFPLAVPRQSAAPGALPGTHAPWCAVFGAACTAFGLWAPVSLALYGPQLSGHHVTPQREMLAALGLALRGVWFFALGAVCLLAAWRVYAQREGRALALGPGVAASGALYLHAVLRFIDAPASLHHVQPTAEVLCALCAVLFFAALLRAAAPEGAAARGMCRAGWQRFISAPAGACRSLCGSFAPAQRAARLFWRGLRWRCWAFGVRRLPVGRWRAEMPCRLRPDGALGRKAASKGLLFGME